MNLNDVIIARQKRVDELENAFWHTHKPENFGDDRCKVCGLGIRDNIHLRVGDLKGGYVSQP